MKTASTGIYVKQQLKQMPSEQNEFFDKNGEDVAEIRSWKRGVNKAGKPTSAAQQPEKVNYANSRSQV